MKNLRFSGMLAVILAASCSVDRIGPEGASGEFHSVQPCTVSVTRVYVQPRLLNLYIGQKGQLTVTVYPSDATDKRVRWTNSIGGGAWVDQNGLVTTYGKGWTNVTVHTLDGDYQSTARVHVTCNNVAGVEFEHADTVVLTRGERFDLQAHAIGEDRAAPPSYPGLEWTSSDPQAVSVDPDTGRVTALASGEALITATSASDKAISASCRVVVLNAGPSAEGGIGFRDIDKE